jgi:hypothetical protein
VTDGIDPPREGVGDGAEARKAYLLRLPPALLAAQRRWADEDLRSLNGHLEFLLRQALERRRKGGEASAPAGGSPAADGGAGGAPAVPQAPTSAGAERPGGDGEPIDPE